MILFSINLYFWRKCTFGPYILELFLFWSLCFYFTAFSF